MARAHLPRLKNASSETAGRLSIPPLFSWIGEPDSCSLESTLNLNCGAIVTITLNLSPEAEAGLLAHAQASGMTPGEFLTRQVEVLTRALLPSPANCTLPPQRINGRKSWTNGWTVSRNISSVTRMSSASTRARWNNNPDFFRKGVPINVSASPYESISRVLGDSPSAAVLARSLAR
jgi:hypothetical protein